LIQFFGSIGLFIIFILKMIKNFLLKYLGHAAIISFQFSVTAITITFVLAVVAFAVTGLISLYNLIQRLFDFVSSGVSGGGLLSCFFSVLSCSGVASGIDFGISVLMGVLSSILLFRLMVFIFYGIKIIGNEIFKLGVLLGQALNS